MLPQPSLAGGASDKERALLRPGEDICHGGWGSSWAATGLQAPSWPPPGPLHSGLPQRTGPVAARADPGELLARHAHTHTRVHRHARVSSGRSRFGGRAPAGSRAWREPAAHAARSALTRSPPLSPPTEEGSVRCPCDRGDGLSASPVALLRPRRVRAEEDGVLVLQRLLEQAGRGCHPALHSGADLPVSRPRPSAPPCVALSSPAAQPPPRAWLCSEPQTAIVPG